MSILDRFPLLATNGGPGSGPRKSSVTKSQSSEQVDRAKRFVASAEKSLGIHQTAVTALTNKISQYADPEDAPASLHSKLRESQRLVTTFTREHEQAKNHLKRLTGGASN